MKYYISAFLVVIIFFSCNKKQEKNIENQEPKSLLSIVEKHPSFKKVKPLYLKDIEQWKELKAVDKFLTRFEKASPNEVLGNALELKSLVKSLRDSVKPKLFDNPSFKTRVHILYNETLRLADMTFIPAIKAKEVNHQTNKILEAFSAVNSKVNTTLSKKRFEDAIEIDVKFIGLDSTKIDSVSKKSIKNSLLDKKKLNKRKLPKKRSKLSVPAPKN